MTYKITVQGKLRHESAGISVSVIISVSVSISVDKPRGVIAIRARVLFQHRGPVGKWKKRIGKTEDDNCGKCGVQETGWHLVFECPVSKEAGRQR